MLLKIQNTKMCFLLIIVSHILYQTSQTLEVNLPRADQISLAYGETKFLDLDNFFLGENLNIQVNSISPATSLLNLPESPQPISKSFQSFAVDFSSIITEAPKYVYGLSTRNEFYLIEKQNSANLQIIDLNRNIKTHLDQCFGMAIFAPYQFVIDCNLQNQTQIFFILSVLNGVLQFEQTITSPQPFPLECQRTLASSMNYFFQYCSGLSDFAQVFGYLNMNVTFISNLNSSSLGLAASLCIQNLTNTPQLYNVDQMVLFDANNGVVVFNVLKEGTNITFQYGSFLSLKASYIRYLAKRIHNHSLYEIQYDTHLLIEFDGFVYEITVKDLAFQIIHHYLFKTDTSIKGAALTQDYAVFLVIEKLEFTVRVITRASSFLSYLIPLDAPNYILLGSAEFEENTFYLFDQSEASLTRITVSRNIIQLSCCNSEVSNLSSYSLNLTVCELNQQYQYCYFELLNFYVFPMNYTDPIPIGVYNTTNFLFVHSQKFSVRLNDLFAGPAPSDIQLSLSKSGTKEVDLKQTYVFDEVISGSSDVLPEVINDLITNMLFTDIYWTSEGQILNIVNHITRNNLRLLNVLQCQINENVNCSYYKTKLDDHNRTVQQIIYFQKQLYIILGSPALIFIFGDSFKQISNSSLNCNSISVNTGNSGHLLCFTDNQICIFDNQQKFIGCPFQTTYPISQPNDRYLIQQILLVSNQTHIICLRTSNLTSFEIIDTMQVCVSQNCNFKMYLWGIISNLRMVVVNIIDNYISEYDLSSLFQPVLLRNYSLYGASISLNQSIQATNPDFIPVVVENFDVGGTLHQSLFIYNPRLETNKVLVNLILDLDPDTYYYYTSGNLYETVVGLKGQNSTLTLFYKNPEITFNLTLNSQILQEDVQADVEMIYSNIFSNSPKTNTFTVDCDISNFFISNSSGVKQIYLNTSQASVIPPCVGPISGYSLQCETVDTTCPYVLRPFVQKYSFFTNFYQTFSIYGFPIKVKYLNEFLVLLSQKTLLILRLGLGGEESDIYDITSFGSCSDLIIANSTIYILCESAFQSFSLYVKTFEGFDQPKSQFFQIPIEFQFQEITKIRIINDLIFILGNSTQTYSINDISIYQQIKTNNVITGLQHLTDFTNLFSGFSTFNIESFDFFFIGKSIIPTDIDDIYSDIYGIFVLYAKEVYYAEVEFRLNQDGSLSPIPMIQNTTTIQYLFDNVNEMGDLVYLLIEGFTITPNDTSYAYNFTLTIGTLYNIYVINLGIDKNDFKSNSSIIAILKGYSGCLNYYGDQPKSFFGIRANLCYRINTTLGAPSRLYTLLIYNSLYNNSTLLIKNQSINVSFPMEMITSPVVANTSSFLIYQTEDEIQNKTNHIVLSHTLYQFEDYILFDELLVQKNLSAPNPISTQNLFLTAYNDYSAQILTLEIILPTEDDHFLTLFYFICFGLSFMIIGVYFLLKHKNKRKKVRIKQAEVYEVDEDDDYAEIIRTKNLMQ